MAKKKVSSIDKIYAMIFVFVGVAITIMIIYSSYQSFDVRSNAASKRCIPRPPCLDDPDPKQRCKLKIPNVCLPDGSNYNPTVTPIPKPTRYHTPALERSATLYPAPTKSLSPSEILCGSSKLRCLGGEIPVYIDGRCVCPPPNAD